MEFSGCHAADAEKMRAIEIELQTDRKT
jgi:hypothetical protein